MSAIIRLSAAILALLHSNGVIAGTIATVAAGLTASQAGIDPMPWVIGALGATVVYAYRQPLNRRQALADGVICIFIGGVIAPWVGALVAQEYGATWSNQYVLAGILSVAWPWAVPVVWERTVSAFKALSGMKRDRNA
jgi:MFS family permease